MKLKGIKLPIITQDKANHFLYGFFIYAIASLVLSNPLSFGVVVLAAFAKELYDEYDYGGFDYKDAIMTIIPGIILKILN